MRLRLLAIFAVLLLGGAVFAQNVTLTGTIQAANGLPVPNTVINFTPTQSFFIPGINSSVPAGNAFSPSVPSGSCTINGQFTTFTGNSSLYQCINNVWVTISSNANYLQQVVPSPALGVAVLYPTVCTTTIGGSGVGTCQANGSSASFSGGVTGAPGFGTNTATATFSGWQVPSYIGTITSIVAFSIIGEAGNTPPAVIFTNINCGGGGSISTTGSNLPLAQRTTALLGTSPSIITGYSCYAGVQGSEFGSPLYLTIDVASVGLIVNYTGGSAPPSTSSTLVDAPLNYNQATNTLSVDPNASFPGLNLQPTLYANLPSAAQYTSTTSPVYLVTDSTSSSACGPGGGSNAVQCISNGSSWRLFSAGVVTQIVSVAGCSFASGAIGNYCNGTITLPQPEPDTNYVPLCTMVGPSGITGVGSNYNLTTTSFNYYMWSMYAPATGGGTVSCVIFHAPPGS